MSLYAGVNNTPKKVASFLIGVNNVVKTAVAAYAGNNGAAKKVYESFNLDTDLGNVNPVKALTSGKITSDYIGKTVYLSNSAADCQEWRIADVNHDGTYGTVDLFPKYVLQNTARAFDSSTQYYKKSSLRTWLNGDFYNGFTNEIKNAMKVQNFPSNEETLSDKVKCPSLNEVGCNDSMSNCTVEGAIYPIFGTQQLRPNNLAKFIKANGGAIYNLWTRSRYTYPGEGDRVWTVANDGRCYSSITIRNNGCSVIACIRF